ncbi:MAG: glycoside hydrolase family 38 C-terminal domain-containing protein [bacterium]
MLNRIFKSFIFLFACAALILSLKSVAKASTSYGDVAAELNTKLAQFDVAAGAWKYRSRCDEKCFLPEFSDELKWKSAAPGMYWSEAFQTFWFRRNYKIPDKVAGRDITGSKITMVMNVSDGGDVYVNGEKKGSANDGTVITENAKTGEQIVLGVKVSNGTWPGAYLSTTMKFSVFDETITRTRYWLETTAAATSFIKFETDKDRWTKILNESAAKIDIAALANNDDKTYFASLDAANAALFGLSPLFKQYTVYLDGYSHIDLAWLWDKAEGEDVTKNTLTTVYKLLGEYPEWIYSHSQAHGVKWMEDDYPEVYSNLKKLFKAGRIELVGGTWSEHDSNITGGEGLVRQFLYGKRYFRTKFGKDIVVAWTPDSFGYNWNLPQILVKSGMIGFLTQKLGSNESTRFPYQIFWWQGADGSKILTYFPPSGYANPIYRGEIFGQLASINSNHGVKEDYVIFGVGDHGGGVTRGHLDRAFALKNDPLFAKVKFSSAENYYKHLNALAKKANFPTWNDELYLEHHRGTYTSQSNNKKNNRRCEQLLMDSEKLASIAEIKFGAPYPAKGLFDNGWYYVLLNHMHDILPGSGIRKVYEDADKDYAKVYKEANAVIGDSLKKIAGGVNTDGAGEPLLVFNTLSWKRDAIVEEPFDGLTSLAQVIDPKGAVVPSQITIKNGKQNILFIARNLPGGGYSVYRVRPNAGLKIAKQAVKPSLTSGADFIENNFLKISFDPATGDLKSIYDKKLKREFLKTDKKSDLIQAFKDTQNAWEIQSSDPIEIGAASGVKIVESGPVRITLKSERKLNNSLLLKYVSLLDNDPLAYGKIDIKMHDHNTTLKLAFFLNLLNEDAWFEIPYAAISRKAIPKTMADKAKFEVSAHNWVDYTDSDSSAGISLLNNSKYGFDVKENVLRMTLLRTPITPDPEADQGDRSIEYALYTHAGDWRAADTSRRGNEFNYTAHVVRPGKHKGKLPATNSFFSASPDNVYVSAVKKAEDGGAFIIRIVETEGRPAKASIKLPFTPKKVVETNLIEDVIKSKSPINLKGDTVSVHLGKYEIKTLKAIK